MVQSVWGTVRLLFDNPSCHEMARGTGPEQLMDVRLICSITLAGGQARGPIRTTAIWRVLFGHVKGIFPLDPLGVYGFSHGLPTLRSSIPFFLPPIFAMFYTATPYMLYILSANFDVPTDMEMRRLE